MDVDPTLTPAEPQAEDTRLPTPFELSLLRRRSDEYRRDPGRAVPLEEALDRIERMLG